MDISNEGNSRIQLHFVRNLVTEFGKLCHFASYFIDTPISSVINYNTIKVKIKKQDLKLSIKPTISNKQQVAGQLRDELTDV